MGTPIAGSVDTAQIDLDVYGGDTVAVLTMTRDGVSVSVGAAVAVDYGEPALVNKSWRSRVAYPQPGLYRQLWTVTGTGETKKEKLVAVGPAGLTDTRPTYATTTQLANYLQDAPPLDADRLLRNATADVNDATFTWVYETDEDEMPVDVDLLAVFVEATCEQARWRSETGSDEADQMAGWSSVSIAGVAMSRRSGQDGDPGGVPKYSPKLAGILAKAVNVVRGPWH